LGFVVVLSLMTYQVGLVFDYLNLTLIHPFFQSLF
jgi:hypothetical protein